MQANHIDSEQLAELLKQSNVLDMVELGSHCMYVLEFTGQDILAFADMTGAATVIYPPESFDAESGGSIHDHARG